MAKSNGKNNDDIPLDWKAKALCDITTIQSGGTPSRTHSEYFSGTIPWVKTLDLNENLVTRTQESITNEGFQSIRGRLRPKMTVMVAMYGGAGTVGKSGILGIEAATNQAVCCIEPNPLEFDSWYLLYYMIWYRRKWMQYAIGTRKDPNISKGIIEKSVVLLPPLTEQRTIAAVLRTVQQAKEATEKVIEAARTLKQSLMRHLFTYGLVPFDKAVQVELQETRFGEAPLHWKVEPLDDCCVVQTGIAKGRQFGDDETVDLPYLRVANVQGGYLDLREIKNITIRKREIQRFSLNDGDVVLTEGGDFDKLGRGFIWRNEIPGCLHQNHVFAVRVDRRKLLPEFVAHQTQSEYGRAYFLSVAHRTTNLACINSTKLKAFPVMIPPLSEQRGIEANMGGLDKWLAQEEKRSLALSSLFDSLLHELMTGQRRVAENG